MGSAQLKINKLMPMKNSNRFLDKIKTVNNLIIAKTVLWTKGRKE